MSLPEESRSRCETAFLAGNHQRQLFLQMTMNKDEIAVNVAQFARSVYAQIGSTTDKPSEFKVQSGVAVGRSSLNNACLLIGRVADVVQSNRWTGEIYTAVGIGLMLIGNDVFEREDAALFAAVQTGEYVMELIAGKKSGSIAHTLANTR